MELVELHVLLKDTTQWFWPGFELSVFSSFAESDSGPEKRVKAHKNGRNIVGQQHATLLGPTCCVRLHGTTTMLALDN